MRLFSKNKKTNKYNIKAKTPSSTVSFTKLFVPSLLLYVFKCIILEGFLLLK